jgi:hypothetical protein
MGMFDTIFTTARITYGAANAVASAYKGSLAKIQVSQLHRKCFETNTKNRGIIQAKSYNGMLPLLKEEVYLCTPTENDVRIALLPSKKIGTMQSTIVTGGKSEIRNFSIGALINDAISRNIPVITVHCDNENLVQILKRSIYNDRIELIERGCRSYNPFMGMNSLEIAKILFDSIPEKYQVKYGARDIISVMSELIFAQKMNPSPDSLAKCPVFQMTAIIKKMSELNIIQKTHADRLISDYNASQSEVRTLSHYLMDLGMQLNRMTNDNGYDSYDIKKSIENRGAVVINVGSNSNDLAISLVANHTKLLTDQGYQYMLVLDGLDLQKYKQLLELCIHNRIGFVLSNDDLFSSLGGDEKVFSSVTGSVGKVIIHATASGFSCQQWSKYIGDYERHEPKDTIGIGQQGIIGSNVNQGTSVDIRREARVPPEVINQLSGTQACIYDGTTNGIFFANLY